MADAGAVDMRAEWVHLLVEEGGLEEEFAERAYDCAHRIGRGAGRLEALEMVRETGSVIEACDAFAMLNEVEGLMLGVEL